MHQIDRNVIAANKNSSKQDSCKGQWELRNASEDVHEILYSLLNFKAEKDFDRRLLLGLLPNPPASPQDKPQPTGRHRLKFPIDEDLTQAAMQRIPISRNSQGR